MINTTSSEASYGYYLFKVKDNDTLEALQSDISSSSEKKTYNLYLEAGTYYILFQRDSSAKDNQLDYSLAIEVTMADELKTYDIGKIRYERYLPGVL